MAPTVSGTVTDKSGNTASWSATWTVNTTPTTPLPLVGMSAPKSLWSQRYAELGADGPLLQARRLFMDGGPTDSDLQPLTNQADAAGQVPHISFKVSNDWAGTADGRFDTALANVRNYLNGRQKKAYITFHHEPDQQSTPRDIGEGGTAQEFAAMFRHLIPLMQSEWIKVGPCFNGWWWSDQARGFTDSDIAMWLPADVRQACDFVAADHYTSGPNESETAADRLSNMVAWAKRVGGVKALGVWETNAFTATDLTAVFNLAKTEPLFRGGACLVWNSQGDSYLPLVETGLLDDYQAILRGWPR